MENKRYTYGEAYVVSGLYEMFRKLGLTNKRVESYSEGEGNKMRWWFVVKDEV